MSLVRVAFFAPSANRMEAASQIAAILGDPPESAQDDLAAHLSDAGGASWWAGCGAFEPPVAQELVQVAAGLGCPAFAWSEADGEPLVSSAEGPSGPWSYGTLIDFLGLTIFAIP
jgi:hypothetical protein